MSKKIVSTIIKPDFTKSCDYPQFDLIATGKNLKRLRLSCNLTQEVVASLFPEYISASAISQWENGKAKPELKHLAILKQIYGNCSFDDLIVLDRPKKEAS